jgi:hypothetical protein
MTFRPALTTVLPAHTLNEQSPSPPSSNRESATANPGGTPRSTLAQYGLDTTTQTAQAPGVDTPVSNYPAASLPTNAPHVYDVAAGEIPPGLPPHVQAFLALTSKLRPLPHDPNKPYTPLEVVLEAGKDRAKVRDQVSRLAAAQQANYEASKEIMKKLNSLNHPADAP